MLDALADGGVYAGIPKEMGLRLIAHTMIVGRHLKFESFPSLIVKEAHIIKQLHIQPHDTYVYILVWKRLEKFIADIMDVSSITQTHRVLQGWF